MQALDDPGCEMVVMMTSSQVGKTECGLNWIGKIIDHDPAPMLIVMPNLEDARTFSRIRLAPMLRDTPRLRGKVKDARGKKKDRDGAAANQTTHKTFPGGHLTIVGSNSPSGLAAKPIPNVYVDELDRFELSAGTEGDQIQLARRRMQNFWKKKILLTSTPGVKGISRIEAYFLMSDQRKYHVPCPFCYTYQELKWGNCKWEKDEEGEPLYDTVHFECVSKECRGKITDRHKLQLVEAGRWVKTKPENEIAGFHLWVAYSPWVTWVQLVKEFRTAIKGGDESLKAFINTMLGETWEEKGDAPEWQILANRADHYLPWQVPAGVMFLTAGVDVQGDRIEVSVWGWGHHEEAWFIGHEIIYGDMDSDDTARELDNFLLFKRFEQPTAGRALSITCAAVDAAHKNNSVYRYARARGSVRAVRGASSPTAPRVGSPSMQDINWKGEKVEKGVKLWSLGTHLLKATIYQRLRLKEVGPRFIHFCQLLPDEWYRQLTAERLVTRRDKNHQPKQEWVRIRERNEALDCFVYAYAAALMVGLERIPWDYIDLPTGRAPAPRPTPTTPEAPPAPAEQVAPRGAPQMGQRNRFNGRGGGMGRLLRR